jgi:hypothetical protein
MNINDVVRLVTGHKFKYSDEKDLQAGLEKLFTINNVPFRREVRLTSKDILDFVIDGEKPFGIEVKIDGSKNSLLRQINRYLAHDEIEGIFVIGSPYWVNNLPMKLNDKPIYRYRLLTGIL